MSLRLLRRIGLISAATASLFAATLTASALLGACGGEEATTSSKRVSLKTQITADAEVTKPFVNAYGWSIALTKAAVSVGSLYYFDGAPIFSAGLTLPAPGSRQALARLLGVGTAYAHPGHYQPGNAMGQMLQASSADLMKGTVELPLGDGVAGIYRSARFTFGDEPTGSAAAELGTNVVVIEGVATKDTMTRNFRVALGKADVLDSYGEPTLEGCSFDKEPDVEADGTMTIHIKPSIWLDQAEFDDVPEGTAAAPVDLTPDEEAYKAFSRGIKKGTAVIFSYAK